jgi:hypothetical protein
VSRDYENPEDYADPPEYDEYDEWADRNREADAEEAAVRRWEARREMPYDDDHEATYVMWLRREEYGDQDTPSTGEAA